MANGDSALYVFGIILFIMGIVGFIVSLIPASIFATLNVLSPISGYVLMTLVSIIYAIVATYYTSTLLAETVDEGNIFESSMLYSAFLIWRIPLLILLFIVSVNYSRLNIHTWGQYLIVNIIISIFAYIYVAKHEKLRKVRDEEERIIREAKRKEEEKAKSEEGFAFLC